MSGFRQLLSGPELIMVPMSELFYRERFNTPTGWMLLVTDCEQRLRSLEWEDKGDRMRRLLRLHYGENGYRLEDSSAQSPARQAVEAYFAGELEAIAVLRTETRGTALQRAVWSALRNIPAGTTLSYGQLAREVGNPRAVRAVGAANGANPMPIVVPCHRVIGSDGSLTGFGGGLERKRWLLAHELSYSGAPVRRTFPDPTHSHGAQASMPSATTSSGPRPKSSI
jgi:methylated-DNA-[protein]-cysteine S-methyltransferase